MSNQYFLVGHTQNLNANTFTRSGYEFLGWSTSSSATSPTYTNQQPVSSIRTTSGTTTLYAVWRALDYNVIFEYSGYPSKVGGLAGGFENSGWNLSSGNGAYDTTHVRSGSHALKITGSSGASESTIPTINTITINESNSDHKFYVQYWGYQETRTNGSTQVYWPLIESPMAVEVGTNTNRNMSLGPAGQWNMYSFYDDRLSVQNYSAMNTFRIDFDNAGNAGEIWIDDVILLDLTEIFGAGNEPSKAWCDENISSGTNTQTIAMNTSTALENRQGSDTYAYYFAGWSTTPKTTSTTTQTINYTNGQSVNNIASAGGTITLYAVWQYRAFTRVAATSGGEVRVSGNDLGRGSTSDSVTYTAVPYKDYYFINWAVNGSVYQQNGTTYTGTTLSLPRADAENSYIVAVFSTNASSSPSASFSLQNNFGITSTIGGEARLIGCLDAGGDDYNRGHNGASNSIDEEAGSSLLNLKEVSKIDWRSVCLDNTNTKTIVGTLLNNIDNATIEGTLPLVDWRPGVTQDDDTDNADSTSTTATTATLIAVVTEKGYRFSGWYVDGVLVSTDSHAEIDMNILQGKIIEARFEEINNFDINDSIHNGSDLFDPTFD